MAALAGFGAHSHSTPGQETTKAPKAPPALFPKFAVEEPGDFPRLRSLPLGRTETDLVKRSIQLRVNRADRTKFPYYLKPPAEEQDVERFSDALRRDQDEQAYLDAFVHSATRYLPREIRAPLLPVEDEEIAAGNGMLLEGTVNLDAQLDDILLPTLQPIYGMPIELVGDMPLRPAESPAITKRKRVDEDKDESQRKKRKKGKEKEDSPKKKTTTNKSGEDGTTELDFNNLAKHKMGELRAFCKDRGIEVTTRTKQGIIEHIKAWKEKQPKPKPAAAPISAPSVTAVPLPTGTTTSTGLTAVTRQDGTNASGKTDTVNGDHGKLPRQPLDRISRLAMIEEEQGVEENELEGHQRNITLDDEEDDDDNDYNKRYESEDEEDNDDDDDVEEPTF